MMIFAQFTTIIQTLGDWIWGWPLVIFSISAGLWMTFITNFIQIRYFFTSWRYLFTSLEHKNSESESYITPIQAFVNTLSASIGNGVIAGMATAMYSGGPGAAFWIFIIGFLNMALRFAEVFISIRFSHRTEAHILRGGPMVFLTHVPGGSWLPSLYAFFCLFVSFVAGSAVQCNSMRVGIDRLTHLPLSIITLLLFVFVAYIMSGGSHRIIKISETIIPLKVSLFFIVTLILLFYHAAAIPEALKLIVSSAFSVHAVTGAVMGYTVQHMFRYGISRSLSATEVGLGTAGVLFGSTASKYPMRNGIMSMASVVISNHLVCCLMLLLFVVTGVWNSGLTSTAMTSAAYETVFGIYGVLIITILSIIFGMGVLVAYAYIGKECWIYLTKGRFVTLYPILYCAMAIVGSLSRVDIIWEAVDIGNAGMMIINVYGLIMLSSYIRTAIITKNYDEKL